MAESIRLLASVFKLRIGVAIAFSALAGIAVTSGPAPAAWQVGLLALAVLLASAAAGAFNQFVERDLDAQMHRTRNRPFVTGRYVVGGHWVLGLAVLLLVAVTAAALAANLAAALYVFLGAIVYGVVYTVWLKRRSSLNIVVGGLSGSFAVLAGAAAVDPSLGPEPIILAIVLFLWTPPHFWSLAFALRDDYRAAGVPMLPVVVDEQTAAWIIFGHTLVLVLLALLPAAYGLGWIYFAGAAVGGALFLRGSLNLVRQPGRAAAMANFRASLIQLGLLLTAAIADAWILA